MSDGPEDETASPPLDVTRRAFLARATVAGIAAAPLLPDRARAGEGRCAPAGLSPAARGGAGTRRPALPSTKPGPQPAGPLRPVGVPARPQGGRGGGRLVRALPSPRAIAVPCSWNELFDDAQELPGPRLVPHRTVGARGLARAARVPARRLGELRGEGVGERPPGGRAPGRPSAIRHRDHRPARVGSAERHRHAVENKQLPERVPAGPSPAGGLFSGFMGSYPAATYDFFPYAGLHRPVLLYSVPATHIDDVTVSPTLDGADGM